MGPPQTFSQLGAIFPPPPPTHLLLFLIGVITPVLIHCRLSPKRDGAPVSKRRSKWMKAATTNVGQLSDPQSKYVEEDVGLAQFQQAVTAVVQGALPSIIGKGLKPNGWASMRTTPSLLAGVSGQMDRMPDQRTAPPLQHTLSHHPAVMHTSMTTRKGQHQVPSQVRWRRLSRPKRRMMPSPTTSSKRM